MSETKIMDIPAAVIGLGASGCAAAVYLSRMGIDPVCFEPDRIGGMVNEADRIIGYPGFQGTGAQLVEDLKKQLEENKITVIKSKVESLERDSSSENSFLIFTDDEKIYRTQAVVIATGFKFTLPQMEGVADVEDMISLKPISDREKCREKEVVVWGSDDLAVSAALNLADIASSVTLVYKDLDYVAQKLLDAFDSKLNTSKVQGIIKKLEKNGDSFCAYVRTPDGTFSPVFGSMLFPFMESRYHRGRTEFVRTKEIVDDQGGIACGRDSQTFIKGIFAAGDVVQKSLRNLAVDASEGAMAGIGAYRYLADLKK